MKIRWRSLESGGFYTERINEWLVSVPNSIGTLCCNWDKVIHGTVSVSGPENRKIIHQEKTNYIICINLRTPGVSSAMSLHTRGFLLNHNSLRHISSTHPHTRSKHLISVLLKYDFSYLFVKLSVDQICHFHT